jgi:hypothetical protein
VCRFFTGRCFSLSANSDDRESEIFAGGRKVTDDHRNKFQEIANSISQLKIVAVRADDDLPCWSCGEYGPVSVLRIPAGSVDLCRKCLRGLRSRMVTRMKISRIATHLRKLAAEMEALAVH